MPISLLTQAIQSARASGMLITPEDQVMPCCTSAAASKATSPKANTYKRPEGAENHATSAPIPNSRRFPPQVDIPMDDEGLLPRGWVPVPDSLDCHEDNVVHYYRAGTGGEGRKELHTGCTIDGTSNIGATSNVRGPHRVEEESDHDRFRARKLKRKHVPITDLQWIEHWAKEDELAVKATALQRAVEKLERQQANEAECEAKTWATGVFEKDAKGEWVRRDFQAEERLAMEREEEERQIEADRQQFEQKLEEQRRQAREEAAEEMDRAWGRGVQAVRDRCVLLGDAFLDKEDRRRAKQSRGRKGRKDRKRPSRQRRVGGCAGETRQGVLRSMAGSGRGR